MSYYNCSIYSLKNKEIYIRNSLENKKFKKYIFRVIVALICILYYLINGCRTYRKVSGNEFHNILL